MKFKGFTMAEILIVLTIIGIIAAVTLPQLSTDTHKKGYATKLATDIDILENAFGSMLINEDADTLVETQLFKNFLDNKIEDANSHFSSIIKVRETTEELPNDTGWNYKSEFNADKSLNFVLQNGSHVQLYNEGKSNNSERLGYGLIIDVNGDNTPNAFGIDRFAFLIDNSNGNLIPAGSEEWSNIFEGNKTNTWNNISSKWACKASSQNTVTTKGAGCTARLIENGFKFYYEK